MPSGGLSAAIDNRSLADDPQNSQQDWAVVWEDGSVWWGSIHPASGGDVSLSGFYLQQLSDRLHNCFVPSLLNTNAVNRMRMGRNHAGVVMSQHLTYHSDCVWLPALNPWPRHRLPMCWRFLFSNPKHLALPFAFTVMWSGWLYIRRRQSSLLCAVCFSNDS